jgi:uncharacterized protein
VRLRLLVLAGCAIVATGACPATAAPSCTGLPKHSAIPVVDAANVVPPEAEAYLAADLIRFHIEGHEAIVVATVANLGGDDVSSYARRLFDCWGVGDADSDNGVLILDAMREHRARIEVGAGLEEQLAEPELNAALAALAVPMRAGNVAGGLRAAAASVASGLGSTLPDTATLVKNGGASPVATAPDDVPDGAVPSFAVPDGYPSDGYSPYGNTSGGDGIGFAVLVPLFIVLGLVSTLLRAVFRGGLGSGSGGDSSWRGGFPGGGFGARWGGPAVLHRGGWSGWGSGGGSDDSDSGRSSSGSFGDSFGGSSSGSSSSSSGGSSGGGSFGGGSSGGGGASGSW